MIKIQTYQKQGIKTDHIVDEFEFCCWDSLFKWLMGYTLHKCPECKKSNQCPYCGKIHSPPVSKCGCDMNFGEK